MRVIGNVLVAVGAGLGVWIITNLQDTGITDILIVIAIILIGSFLKAVGETP